MSTCRVVRGGYRSLQSDAKGAALDNVLRDIAKVSKALSFWMSRATTVKSRYPSWQYEYDRAMQRAVALKGELEDLYAQQRAFETF